jgi:hypothetical protein
MDTVDIGLDDVVEELWGKGSQSVDGSHGCESTQY